MRIDIISADSDVYKRQVLYGVNAVRFYSVPSGENGIQLFLVSPGQKAFRGHVIDKRDGNSVVHDILRGIAFMHLSLIHI